LHFYFVKPVELHPVIDSFNASFNILGELDMKIGFKLVNFENIGNLIFFIKAIIRGN
jgi:hypothetical protein